MRKIRTFAEEKQQLQFEQEQLAGTGGSGNKLNNNKSSYNFYLGRDDVNITRESGGGMPLLSAVDDEAGVCTKKNV